MNYLKFLIAIIVLIGVLSCSRVTEKVSEKVNKKIDETIDKNLQKVDSAFNKANIDSLKKAMDKLDSLSKKFDKENK